MNVHEHDGKEEREREGRMESSFSQIERRRVDVPGKGNSRIQEAVVSRKTRKKEAGARIVAIAIDNCLGR